MEIAIISNSVVAYDAIGNDIEKMLAILGEKHHCHAYSPYVLNKRISFVKKERLFDLISDPSNLLICHFSIFWKDIENILDCAKCKIVFKYHNITPPEYFERYSKHYYDLCWLGRQLANKLAERFCDSLWLPDSGFNSEDISVSKKKVIPPFNDIKGLSSLKPDDYLLQGLMESNKINLLYVGRIAPNKNHRFLFDVLTDYRKNYGGNIRLHIVGKIDEKLKSYYRELLGLVRKMGLKDHVKFVGEASGSEVLAYYLGCDFYVCSSNHEGFCVPIVEAQAFRLPLIAKQGSAVSETAGAGQILLSDDPAEYSAAIRLLSENPAYLRRLVDTGYNNYVSRFDNSIIRNRFLKALSEYMGVDM